MPDRPVTVNDRIDAAAAKSDAAVGRAVTPLATPANSVDPVMAAVRTVPTLPAVATVLPVIDPPTVSDDTSVAPASVSVTVAPARFAPTRSDRITPAVIVPPADPVTSIAATVPVTSADHAAAVLATVTVPTDPFTRHAPAATGPADPHGRQHRPAAAAHGQAGAERPPVRPATGSTGP